MNKIFRAISFFALCAVIISPLALRAHIIGPSIEKIIDGYRFDIGYTSDPSADDTVRFDLSLFNASTQDEVKFSDAWVRISNGAETVFAGPIAYGEFGKPGFSIIFPHGGDYSLLVRFENGDTSIVEGNFPFKVSPSQNTKQGFSFVIPTIALCAGLCGGFFIAKLKKKHA